MQQHSETPGHRDNRSFFRVSAATLSECEAPSSQICVGPKRAEHVVCALHQQLSQIHVARFGDAQLGLTVAGVVLARYKAEERADLTTLTKTSWIFERQKEGQSGQVTDSRNLSEVRKLRLYLTKV